MSMYRRLYRLGLTPWEVNDDAGPLAEILRGRSPGRALDAGCGTGRHAVALAEQGWTVTGVDEVPQALARARERASDTGVADRVTFVRATSPGSTKRCRPAVSTSSLTLAAFTA